jgi:hypothetical protein
MVIDVVWYWLAATLPILAVAFAAFGIWLGVRIFNRRERWAKRLAVGIACLPILYALGFGPACWLIAYIGVAPPQPNPPTRAVDWIGLVYAPCGQISRHAGEHGWPAFIEHSIGWYAGVAIPKGKRVLIPLSPSMWIHVTPPATNPDAPPDTD